MDSFYDSRLDNRLFWVPGVSTEVAFPLADPIKIFISNPYRVGLYFSGGTSDNSTTIFFDHWPSLVGSSVSRVPVPLTAPTPNFFKWLDWGRLLQSDITMSSVEFAGVMRIQEFIYDPSLENK